MQVADTDQTAGSPGVREPKNFGRRRQSSTIIIERNGHLRHYRISPLAFAAVVSIFAFFAVGYFSATGYLLLRDDLIGMSKARNARLLHEYEDRIAQLRANLDLIKSRQLLDQQAIENRVAELIERQEMLGSRTGLINQLLEKAEERGLRKETFEESQKEASAIPLDPARTGAISTEKNIEINIAGLGGLRMRGSVDGFATAPKPEHGISLALATLPDITNLPETHSVFASLHGSIAEVDARQRAMLDEIRLAASERSRKITGVLASLNLGNSVEPEAVGGPFIPLPPETDFETRAQALDNSLQALDTIINGTNQVPLARPVRGSFVTSAFGTRTDPFLKRAAMHSGIDFKASTGTPILATAHGKVIEAGRNGGYGRMVEIDHGDGITTRYAHMSRITVSVGEQVEKGMVIGKAGSTGRSTGPHLHYEVRRNGDPLNPAKFLKTGRELAKLL